MSIEARQSDQENGSLTCFSRDPRWGRGQETPGEDPFHLKSYVASLIDGLQGGHDPPIKKVVATCKHFVAYDLEMWETYDRYNFDAMVTTQDLAEYYMQPFQTCARDAAVGSVGFSLNVERLKIADVKRKVGYVLVQCSERSTHMRRSLHPPGRAPRPLELDG